MKVVLTKDTYNALTETNPSRKIFSSEYGTLKYFEKGTANIYIDGDLSGNLDSVGWFTITHNLGFVPYYEVYLNAFSFGGSAEYVPTYNGGAGTNWRVLVYATSTILRVYTGISGFFTPPTFYFTYFIFNNSLGL
jgi:hypothetical protein